MKYFTVLLALICCCKADVRGEDQIHWYNIYEEAVQESKATNKPLLLFFTGSDWCSWCHKLEKEVLNTPEFASLAGDKFVFVMLDFPLYKPMDPRTGEQNRLLQKKYDVKGYPAVIILDRDERQIGSTGYQPGGAKSYADHLLKMIRDYSNYRQKVSEVDKHPLSAQDLKELYQKASELGREEDALKIVNLGLSSDEKMYFLLERFHFLAEEGQIHEAEAQATKREILALDPLNEKGSHYEMAVIEFDAYSEEMIKENYAPEIAIEPLVDYIKKFGKQDRDHLWKIQMIISQVFLDKNNLPQALEYARASYDTAPNPAKSDIATAVKNIQSKINKK